jgi:hypothetical protein
MDKHATARHGPPRRLCFQGQLTMDEAKKSSKPPSEELSLEEQRLRALENIAQSSIE